MTPKRLAFSDLPAFSGDPSDTISVVAPREALGYGEHSAYTDLLCDKNRWLAIYHQSLEGRDAVMNAMTPWLDAYHQADKGLAYWEQVIGWFTNYYCDAMITRLAVLEAVTAKHPNIVAIGLDEGDFGRPSGTRTFEAALLNCPWSDLQLWTEAAKSLGLRTETYAAEPGATPFAGDAVRAPAGDLAPGHLWPVGLRSDIMLYKTLMQRRTILQLATASGFRIADIPNIADPAEPISVDAKARTQLASLPMETPMLTALMKGIASLLPSAALETWPDLNACAENWIAKRQPKVIVSGVGGRWNMQFAVWAAECQKRGTRIVGVQHGGCYGERDHTCGESHERRVADHYATWGWREDEGTVALPAARLASIKPRKGPVTDGPILWVGTADSRHVYQIGPRPVGPQTRDYFLSQRAFFEALSSEVARQVLFRPYPREFGWVGQPGLDTALPVKVDDFNTELRERISAARLMVVDHLGSTTLLEAITAKCPVLFFGSPAIFDIRDSARPFYDALQQVGIFHTSAESAANTVNLIADNVQDWWQEPDRQIAINRFSDNFAQSGSFVRKWRRFLNGARRGASQTRKVW